MIFKIDKQTLADIDLFPDRNKDKSLFAYYNRTNTIGGNAKLNEIMHNPVSDLNLLESRKQEIDFFFRLEKTLVLSKKNIDFIEYYLRNGRTPLKDHLIDAAKDSFIDKIKVDSDYYIIRQGINHIIGLLNDLKNFIELTEPEKIPVSLDIHFRKIKDFIDIQGIKNALNNSLKEKKVPKFYIVNKLDSLFREKKKQEFREVLDIIYELDVLQSLSLLMVEESLTLPIYTDNSIPFFEGEECFHPLIEKAVTNSFTFKAGITLSFLTGSNMSGKSTFLKTVAALVYLSHLGFPVPAKRFKISIVSGLYTTINLSDNLNLGLSHFYAEVKRIKDISNEIKSNNNMVVIFDELFRGTNVKDAFEGTLLVVKSLSMIKSSMFFISSHILEVAEDLKVSEHIDFRCFTSKISNHKPVYNYKLIEGVSTERLGMQLIENEGIEDILAGIIKNQKK